jgi:hypothetical protein
MTNELTELSAQVEAVRLKLATLHSELAAFKAQVRSREEVNAQVQQQIATWRAQASAMVAIDLQRMLAGQPVALLEMRAVNGTIQLGPLLIAAMGEAAMSKWLTSLTNQLPEGLNAKERAEKIYDITKEVELVEAVEEALLREADELGYPLDPRPDARPQAAILLGWGDDA